MTSAGLRFGREIHLILKRILDFIYTFQRAFRENNSLLLLFLFPEKYGLVFPCECASDLAHAWFTTCSFRAELLQAHCVDYLVDALISARFQPFFIWISLSHRQKEYTKRAYCINFFCFLPSSIEPTVRWLFATAVLNISDIDLLYIACMGILERLRFLHAFYLILDSRKANRDRHTNACYSPRNANIFESTLRKLPRLVTLPLLRGTVQIRARVCL